MNKFNSKVFITGNDLIDHPPTSLELAITKMLVNIIKPTVVWFDKYSGNNTEIDVQYYNYNGIETTFVANITCVDSVIDEYNVVPFVQDYTSYSPLMRKALEDAGTPTVKMET